MVSTRNTVNADESVGKDRRKHVGPREETRRLAHALATAHRVGPGMPPPRARLQTCHAVCLEGWLLQTLPARDGDMGEVVCQVKSLDTDLGELRPCKECIETAFVMRSTDSSDALKEALRIHGGGSWRGGRVHEVTFSRALLGDSDSVKSRDATRQRA